MPLVVFREEQEETKSVEELTKLLEEGIKNEMGLGVDVFEDGGGVEGLVDGEENPDCVGGTALET